MDTAYLVTYTGAGNPEITQDEADEWDVEILAADSGIDGGWVLIQASAADAERYAWEIDGTVEPAPNGDYPSNDGYTYRVRNGKAEQTLP